MSLYRGSILRVSIEKKMLNNEQSLFWTGYDASIPKYLFDSEKSSKYMAYKER